jgi:hypothetical protein
MINKCLIIPDILLDVTANGGSSTGVLARGDDGCGTICCDTRAASRHALVA